jgi:hypothetical protein
MSVAASALTLALLGLTFPLTSAAPAELATPAVADPGSGAAEAVCVGAIILLPCVPGVAGVNEAVAAGRVG